MTTRVLGCTRAVLDSMCTVSEVLHRLAGNCPGDDVCVCCASFADAHARRCNKPHCSPSGRAAELYPLSGYCLDKCEDININLFKSKWAQAE